MASTSRSSLNADPPSEDSALYDSDRLDSDDDDDEGLLLVEDPPQKKTHLVELESPPSWCSATGRPEEGDNIKSPKSFYTFSTGSSWILTCVDGLLASAKEMVCVRTMELV